MSLQSDVIVVDPTVGELMVSKRPDTDMIAMTTGVVSAAAVYSVPVRSIVPSKLGEAAATATQGCPPQSRLGGVPDAEAGGGAPAAKRPAQSTTTRSGPTYLVFGRVILSLPFIFYGGPYSHR